MNDGDGFIAHTLPDRPESEWQKLQEHLEAVGKTAARFAADFDAEDWGRLAGLWHDLGKYSTAFQDYLRQVTCASQEVTDGGARIDHSSAGAQHAIATMGLPGHLLAYVIAGHHSGLLDARSAGACLEARLGKAVEPWNEAPGAVLRQPSPELPGFVREALGRRDAFTVAFFTRMLFSCLVDADFLDTERFMNPDKAQLRPVWPRDFLERMEVALGEYVAGLTGRGESELSGVNVERARVRRACLDTAPHEPGLFSLTVPTGGGKTLSSLAFALRHARLHGLRRIVYVIPFTSIIEQNAAKFREAMETGDGIKPDPVIEHHSNLDVGKESAISRLASENWDAPLVVTTSVQFYESLFANRTSRCRKLHSLARAVIILDEVQALPVDYLEPCLRVLRELTANYGSTAVLCTATQPAVQRRDDFSIGLESVREIIPDPPRLYERLRRVEVEGLGRTDDPSLSDQILQFKQVLCIVNTRSHARTLFERIGDEEGHFHLSAWMCPAHRAEVLKKIRERLASRRTCRVISTQLVEAGVDIDFPVVYRSLSGVDSIAQAAGRCNRNGRQRSGKTFIFRSEHDASERFFAETANCASQILPLYEDPLSLEAVEHYFRLYYWDQTSRWDAKGIMREFHLAQNRDLPFLFSFSTVAERFQLIEERGGPVIVPWGKEGEARCRQLRGLRMEPSRELWEVLRALQRYTVQVPLRIWNEHLGKTVELVHEQYPVLSNLTPHYSERIGLNLDPGVFLLG